MTTARIDPRFSTFLAGQRTDPSVRSRQLSSGAAAVVALSVAGALAWTADTLGIDPVRAPRMQYAISLDLGPPPPPPTKPPPPPTSNKGAVRAAATPAASRRPVAERPARRVDALGTDATDVTDVSTVVGAAAGVPRAGAPGVPGSVGRLPAGTHGTGTGWGTCPAPPCAGIGDRPRSQPERVYKPVSAVKARALFAPDPDPRRLAKTKSATMRRGRAASSSVAFCVSTRGSITDIHTTQRYPADPEIDRICREAVAKWRFKPFVVGGKARETCTTTTFRIEFE